MPITQSTRATGDVVTIYQDPLSEEKREGDASLVRFDGAIGEYHGREIECWVVQFIGSDEKCERQILTPRGD